MQDHVSLSVDTPFLANDFDKLAKREGAMPGPPGDTNDQALLLKGLWSLTLDQDLGQLAVVRHEDTVMILEITIGDAIRILEGQ